MVPMFAETLRGKYMVSVRPSSFWIIVFLSIACSAAEWEVRLNCHHQNSHAFRNAHNLPLSIWEPKIFRWQLV